MFIRADALSSETIFPAVIHVLNSSKINSDGVLARVRVSHYNHSERRAMGKTAQLRYRSPVAVGMEASFAQQYPPDLSGRISQGPTSWTKGSRSRCCCGMQRTATGKPSTG